MHFIYEGKSLVSNKLWHHFDILADKEMHSEIKRWADTNIKNDYYLWNPFAEYPTKQTNKRLIFMTVLDDDDASFTRLTWETPQTYK